MSNQQNIRESIKQSRNYSKMRDEMIATYAVKELASYCSVYFIKKSVRPNTITLFMILFGIIGSILIAIPDIFCKIAGYICWYLWFTMDVSDGEVARYKKQFSKYGAEMDFIAHLIDHPLMNIAIWLTFLSLDIINQNLLALIFISSISIELIMRNITSFQHYLMKNDTVSIKEKAYSWPKYFLTQFSLYPNMIIIFTPFMIADYYMHTGWALYLYISWFAYYALVSIRCIIQTFLWFYRSK